MNKTLDVVYKQYIKLLPYNDKVFIVQRIMNELVLDEKPQKNIR